MITIRYRVIRSTRMGSAAEPFVVIRAIFANDIPQDISAAAGPYAELEDAYRALSQLARMED